MKDMGELQNLVGVSYSGDTHGAWISQSHYVAEILKRFGMHDCNPVNTPANCDELFRYPEVPLADQSLYQEIVGSLLFISTRTRLDISAAVNILSRYCAAPRKQEMVATKRFLPCLKGSLDYCICFPAGDGKLHGYFHADWAGDKRDRK